MAQKLSFHLCQNSFSNETKNTSWVVKESILEGKLRKTWSIITTFIITVVNEIYN